ncbi:MAG: hypothetical protein KDI71_08855 [Xanthomonadales bacterium]|nr:hypothetical protein [Xanthomonadales bacterium]
MLWMILGRDRADSAAARAAARPAHLERLQALHQQGRVVLAGPLPAEPGDSATGMVGSLIVADFADRQSAEAWISADPYCTDQVFELVEVQPFKQVLP